MNEDPNIKNFNRILAAISRANYFLYHVTQETNRFCPVQNVWFYYEPILGIVNYNITQEYFRIDHVTSSQITQNGADVICSTSVELPTKYLAMSDNDITQDRYSQQLLDILCNIEEQKEQLESAIVNLQAGHKIIRDARTKGIEI